MDEFLKALDVAALSWLTQLSNIMWTSKSDTIVLSRKRLEGLLLIREEILLQLE